MACVNNTYVAKNMAVMMQCSHNVLTLNVEQCNKYVNSDMKYNYRGADKSLARHDWKNKGRHFSSKAEVTAAVETWLDGQISEFFLSGLKKSEFGRCSLTFLVGVRTY